MLVCYIKRGKSFFHGLFSRSILWGYMEIQGIQEIHVVTRGYKGVSKDSKKLQEVTRGYSWLQRVTGGYKGL